LSIAEKFNSKLDKIGNIKSDGRPILGLDAKNLLEIVLETSEKNFLIPAHIWTPWFSMLGSKSGFDSVEACFEDMTPYIFAVETGLSSDPPMNWRVKCLDNLTLISNSDAHSPDKLGREANIFNTELSFSHIKDAMASGDPEKFLGTLEFYPEEGKYHLDGHRKCGISLRPKETIAKDELCPVCGKALTLGVLFRVEALADREEGMVPEKNHGYTSIIPLKEILSELVGVGPNTKKVAFQYNKIIQRLGPELPIVTDLPMEQITSVDIPLFSEAIQRVRNQKVEINPGYDGEFGKIKIFSSDEKKYLSGQKSLFMIPPEKSRECSKNLDGGGKQSKEIIKKINVLKKKKGTKERKTVSGLNEKQKKAVHHDQGPMIIVAGPGTGKTLTITKRIAYLIKNHKISSKNILALTFTNKAAEEMRRRLKKMSGGDDDTIPQATTFHAFCFDMLHQKNHPFRVIDENERSYFVRMAADRVKNQGVNEHFKIRDLVDGLVKEKQQIRKPLDNPGLIKDPKEVFFQRVYAQYQQILLLESVWDYEDLLGNFVQKLLEDTDFKEKVKNKYKYVFVDEYQDINYAQYCIIKEMVPQDADICVIGDPDQSIYAFRGSDVRYFNRFVKDYPEAEIIRLTDNYRSTQTVLDASRQMIRPGNDNGDKLISQISGPDTINIMACGNASAEAVVVGKEIEKLIGGMGFYSIDFNKTQGNDDRESCSFGDFAVLYRTGRQGEIFSDVFTRAGIPHQMATKADAFSEKSVFLASSFLKILEKSGSYIDIERVARYTNSGLGKKTLAIWKQWAVDNGFSMETALKNIRRFPVKKMKKERQLQFNQFIENLEPMRLNIQGLSTHEKIEFILQESTILKKAINNENSREILQKFIEETKTYKTSQDFFRMSALQTDVDQHESDAEKVSLMSMHASKGLEFPVVFVCGCEDGYIPYKREGRENEAEERRLLYVAMTRAKQTLYLTYAKKRRIHGKTEYRQPSKFIRDIESRLKEYHQVIGGVKKKEQQIQLKLFQ